MLAIAVREGLEMRLMQPYEAEAIFEAVHRHREYLREWLPWVDGTLAADNTRDFISKMLREFASGDSIATSLWWRGAFVGACGAHRIDAANRSAEIGYWLVPDAQGQGIVTSAVETLTRRLIRDRGLHRVAIRCAVANAKSCAIAERLGFRFEGVQRCGELLNGRFVDLRVYSKLATD